MSKFKAFKSLLKVSVIYIYSLSKKKEEKIKIDIVIEDVRMEPYYFAIIFSLLQKKYQVNLYVSWKWLAGTGKWMKIILKNPLLHIKLGKPNGKNRLITDKSIFKYENLCFLNPSVYNLTYEFPIIPFPMHPDQYASGRYLQLDQWRNNGIRPIRIMFSGNASKEAYDNQKLSNFFKLPNRWQIVEFLQTEIEQGKIKMMQSKNDWQFARNGDFKSQLIMGRWEWSEKNENNLDARIPNEDWLKTLGSADFFIACPGITIPQSHNCIEAMAMGSIPVLSYHTLFQPHLVDGFNCLTFDTLEELKMKIESILKMEKEIIAEMRKNVLNYYSKYLTSDYCADLLIDRGTTELGYYNEVPAYF